jgi:hypothetical protein
VETRSEACRDSTTTFTHNNLLALSATPTHSLAQPPPAGANLQLQPHQPNWVHVTASLARVALPSPSQWRHLTTQAVTKHYNYPLDMGVIKRKAAHPGRVEPGVRYHCDACNGDITFTVSPACAAPLGLSD